jgi:hypothetical protein
LYKINVIRAIRIVGILFLAALTVKSKFTVRKKLTKYMKL